MLAQQTVSLSPLTTDRSFRILQLQAVDATAEAQGSNDAIYCTIKEFSLDKVPLYETISYRCDHPDTHNGHTVFCNGQPVNVGPNLYSAMLQFRLTTKPRNLWIDLLCIDQFSDEKLRQIMLMNEIYSKAERVLIWLGPAAEHSDIAMRSFPMLKDYVYREILRKQQQQNRDEDRYQDWFVNPASVEAVSINRLFSRPWFERLWTLQEATLASDESLICCGAQTFPYNLLHDFVDQSQHDVTGTWISTKVLIDLEFSHTRIIHHLRETISGNRKQDSAWVMLDNVRSLVSIEACDRLFALSRFLPKDLMNRLVAIGRDDLKRLYTEVAAYEIEHGNGHEITACAGLSQQSSDRLSLSDLPTWVPDWTFNPSVQRLSRSNRQSLKRVGKPLYGASGNFKTNIRLKVQDDVLQMRSRSRIVCKITHCLRPFPEQRSQPLTERFSEHVESCMVNDEYLHDSLRLTNSKCEDGPYQNNDLACCHALVAGQVSVSQGSHVTGAFITASDIQVREGYKIAQYALWCLKEGETIKRKLSARDKTKVTAEDTELLSRYKDVSTSLTNHLQKHGADVIGVFNTMTMNCRGRRFFVTDNKYVGIGPSMLREGDSICIVPGCVTPLAIRPRGLGYSLLGECYVHGMMQGELLTGGEDFFQDDLVLV